MRDPTWDPPISTWGPKACFSQFQRFDLKLEWKKFFFYRRSRRWNIYPRTKTGKKKIHYPLPPGSKSVAGVPLPAGPKR